MENSGRHSLTADLHNDESLKAGQHCDIVINVFLPSGVKLIFSGNGFVYSTESTVKSPPLVTDGNTKTKQVASNIKRHRTNGGNVFNEELFNKFYQAYPRKVGKGAAIRAWKKLNPDKDLVDKMLAAIEIHKQSEQWKDRQYIPHPSTWLNQHRWEDEVVIEESIYFGEEDKVIL